MSYVKEYTTCSIYGCDRELFWRTLCREHRGQLPIDCVLDDCVKPARARGLCSMHGLRLRKYGDVNTVLRSVSTDGLTHGTLAGYKHHGCRCDDCRRAKRESDRAWRARHPEKVLAMSRRQRQSDPERMREYKRAWKQRNPDKVVNVDPRRAAAPFNDAAVEYAAIIINDPCVYCGEKSQQIDHVTPLRDGGTSDWSNLAPTCASCNGSKGAKSLLDYLLYRAAN